MKDKRKRTNIFFLLWYSYPRVAVGVFLLAINLAVILLFTVILTLISGNDFWGELSYLFTFTMCSDGIYDFVNNQEDVACFIVKIILVVIQMLIFSGALIGFTTDIIQNAFDNRIQNKGKMHLKNHFVFLNWSIIGQNMIYDLSYMDGEKTVVILTDDDREDVINSIDNIFTSTGRKRGDLHIFVKKGDPTSSKHLADISISEAKHIGILLPNVDGDSNGEISIRDMSVFKLLLSIFENAPNANIVVETESEIAKEKIEQVIGGIHPTDNRRIAVFSHDAVMGHILGRATVDAKFASLFQQILSFEGAEFYGVPKMDLEEALYQFRDCIPVINYDDDEINACGDKKTGKLYVLSDDNRNFGVRDEKKSFVKPMEYAERIDSTDFTLFIFSDSNRAHFVVSELENVNLNRKSKIHWEIFSYTDQIDDIIGRIDSTGGNRKILLLSKEKNNIPEQDNEVFLLLLYLKTNLAITRNIEIYVELENTENLSSVHNLGIASVILTNKIISLYMLQLLTHSGARKFFKDILLTNSDTGDLDFEIIPAQQLLVFHNGPLVFSCYSEIVQSFYLASNKRRMLMGYFPDNANEACFFCSGMDEERRICINPSDKLIVVTYR